MPRLTTAFYSRDAISVARDLIGCVFVHDSDEGRTSVRIVEVEAYRGSDDPGSHGYRGLTPRAEVMFGPPGRLYVYFTYGMHWCCNVVCARPGVSEAVLIRAGEPIEGLDLMKERRNMTDERLLASGPARLTQAMGIARGENGTSLVGRSTMWISEDAGTRYYRAKEIAQTVRIGLAEGSGDDLPWRFAVRNNPYTSRRA